MITLPLGSFIDIPDDNNIMDELMAKELFMKTLLELRIDLNKCPKAELANMLKEFKEATNLSLRKMSTITGLNKDKISQLLKI